MNDITAIFVVALAVVPCCWWRASLARSFWRDVAMRRPILI